MYRKPKRIYICGPVSEPLKEHGYLHVYNNFLKTEERLNNSFPLSEVVNPMKLCNAEWSWLRCMTVCVSHLIKCDAICYRTGIDNSRGASLEARIASWKGMIKLKHVNDGILRLKD